MRGAMLVLMLVLMLGTPELFTPESLTSMKLLEETLLVDDHGVDGLVDGGLVVEHVVVVLVDDHEVVA